MLTSPFPFWCFTLLPHLTLALQRFVPFLMGACCQPIHSTPPPPPSHCLCWFSLSFQAAGSLTRFILIPCLTEGQLCPGAWLFSLRDDSHECVMWSGEERTAEPTGVRKKDTIGVGLEPAVFLWCSRVSQINWLLWKFLPSLERGL